MASQYSVDGQLASLPIAIPNKHLANPLSPRTLGQTPPVTPPDSPPYEEAQGCCMSSKLYPPDDYDLIYDSPPVRAISVGKAAAAMNHSATQPLPNADDIFPWAHGIHPENHLQYEFFMSRTKSACHLPTGVRFITVVKVGGDLNSSKLNGAVTPDDILNENGRPGFLSLDPKDGFCVRNFQIQVSKFAALSDILVYADDSLYQQEVAAVSKKISAAQLHFRSKADRSLPTYNTFVIQGKCIPYQYSSTFFLLTSDQGPFTEFECLYPELVAIDSRGKITGHTVEFRTYIYPLYIQHVSYF